MTYQSLAFFTGLFGSLHCVAMCGPLVMAIPFRGNMWLSLVQKIIYQTGRILTYSSIGYLAGSMGTMLNILGLQQALSFITGTTLVIIACYHFSSRPIRLNGFFQDIFSAVASFLSRWMSKPYGGLFAGILHGMIPCGMVYMALAGSLNAGSPFAGAEFMFYFGLGTTPLLMLSSFLPLALKKLRLSQLIIPVLFMIAGSFLVYRSLNIQIPWITSPAISGKEAPLCH